MGLPLIAAGLSSIIVSHKKIMAAALQPAMKSLYQYPGIIAKSKLAYVFTGIMKKVPA